jgi:hypothetical protein
MRNKAELRPKKSPPALSPSEPAGLIAKKPRRSAGREPVLDDLSHRTTLGFCCATTMPTPGREVQAEWPGGLRPTASAANPS